MVLRITRFAALAALLLLLVSAAALAAQAIPDFTFIHCSDDHNEPGARITISEFKTPHPILLTPYNVTSLSPSFIVDTGDVTEFGPTGGAFKTFQSFYDGVTIPYYFTTGNHDNTWRSLGYEVRKIYGSLPYSFDKFGCHFVMFNTAGLQDPWPNIGTEELIWLAKDLAKVGRDTPVFLAFHHPLEVTEFASKYETDRLLDIIRPYNVIALLDGHGHVARHKVFDGLDDMEGGSTWSGRGEKPDGYQIVCIKDGIVSAAYKEYGNPAATRAMFQKPLAPPAKRYPAITLGSPKEAATVKGPVPVKAWVALGAGEVTGAYVEVDGGDKQTLSQGPGGVFTCTVPVEGLMPGAHYMRVSFVGKDSAVYHKSTCFYVQSNKVLWRALMDTGSKTTPTIGSKLVYIGGFDGTVRAYDRKTGGLKWQYSTGGPIAGQILLLGDKVYAGSEDKNLYCLTADKGKFVWKFEAEDPIYSWPVSDGKSVYFGCGTGAFYSVDAATGKQVWKNSDATYNIELKPLLANGKVYYGAWDCYEYCLNTADGKLVWKCLSQGPAEKGAARYYSPANCGPVLTGGTLFVSDRKMRCTLIDDASGKETSFLNGEDVAAVSLSTDGKAVYLRELGNNLRKVNADGSIIWTADIKSDEIPVPAQEIGANVYMCSRRGRVSAVSAADGKLLWEYQATPSLEVLAGVSGDASALYVVGTDGSLTALDITK